MIRNESNQLNPVKDGHKIVFCFAKISDLYNFPKIKNFWKVA